MRPNENGSDAIGNSDADATSVGREGSASALPMHLDGSRTFYQIRKLVRILGPGIVTGAADDDPSGIATYSQVGAQFGFSMLWTMPFVYPFMAGIQEISARLGRVTGRGIAGKISSFYPKWLLYGAVALLLFANVINIGADIGAMGAAANLLIGGPAVLYSVLFTAISVILQIYVPYKTYSKFLKWF